MVPRCVQQTVGEQLVGTQLPTREKPQALQRFGAFVHARCLIRRGACLGFLLRVEFNLNDTYRYQGDETHL